ncbi:hypothetical protein AKO1_014268, partial [Acrasis kona]
KKEVEELKLHIEGLKNQNKSLQSSLQVSEQCSVEASVAHQKIKKDLEERLSLAETKNEKLSQDILLAVQNDFTLAKKNAELSLNQQRHEVHIKNIQQHLTLLKLDYSKLHKEAFNIKTISCSIIENTQTVVSKLLHTISLKNEKLLKNKKKIEELKLSNSNVELELKKSFSSYHRLKGEMKRWKLNNSAL